MTELDVTLTGVLEGLPDALVGQQGPPGDPGADGKPGPDGQAGTDGQPGRDGVNGTDGRDGRDGRDGIDGAKGPTGDKGDPGDKGPTGDPGPPGSSSPSVSIVSSELPVSSVGVQFSTASNAPSQHQLMQLAIDKASKVSNGSLLVDGIVQIDFPLDNSAANIPIRGLGSAENWKASPSAIVLRKDGPTLKEPGIKYSKSWRSVRIRDISLVGPGWGDPQPWGSPVANRVAFNSPGGCRIEDVRANGWHAATESTSDHQRYYRVDFQGNTHAIDFGDSVDGGRGDMIFSDFSFGNQTRSNWALSTANAILNGRCEGNGHMGIAPLVIWRYLASNLDPTTQQPVDYGQAVFGLVFENTSLEYAGGGLFLDEPGTGMWKNIIFDMPAEWGTFGAGKWPGKPVRAHIDVGAAEGIRWRGGTYLGSNRPIIRAKSIKDCGTDRFDLTNIVDFGLKPFEIVGTFNDWGTECEGISLGAYNRFSGGVAATGHVAHEDIGKGELVEMVAYSHVQRSRNSPTSFVCGVSVADYKKGDVCVHATQGESYMLGVRNTSSVTIPQGANVVPDPSNWGGVMQAPDFGQMLKRATDQTSRDAVLNQMAQYSYLRAVGQVNDAPVKPYASAGLGRVRLQMI